MKGGGRERERGGRQRDKESERERNGERETERFIERGMERERRGKGGEREIYILFLFQKVLNLIACLCLAFRNTHPQSYN